VIVVVSDLHLTDGISGTGVEAGAFEVFARLVGEMARHASRRETGFRPLSEGLDLVLLGDILDLLRSTAWPLRSTRGERVPRPWEPPDEIAPTVARAVDGVLEGNSEGLSILRSLARDGALFYEDGQAFRIPLRISYFVGNHDWMLGLPGTVYDEIRARVVDALGLANDPTRPFPHAIAEADRGLAARLGRHRLVLRHGDVHDPFNYDGDRNRSAIGDGVVIELLNRFPEAVSTELSLDTDDPFFLALREVDNVRPFATIPAWVLGVIRRFELEGTPEGERVLAVWNRLGAEFFALDFVRRRDRPWRWDEVDRLEMGFRFVKGFTSGRLVRATLNQLLRLVVDRNRRFAAHALAEPEIESGSASYVAYGHTHVHEIRPLAVRHPSEDGGGAARNISRRIPVGTEPPDRQYYFNSGTWRPSYRQTLAHPERLEFLGFNALTVLAFYSGDERQGRRFEVWNGSLAGPS
jgi:hypothetical protein